MTAPTVLAPTQPMMAPAKSAAPYNVSIGYLRAFITLLVLAHHAALAYDPFAPSPVAVLNGPNRWWQAFPVVDPKRSNMFAFLVGFNDIFFMALMFFLSGLFVWKSLQRKGGASFLRDRAVRLGLPFIVAAAIVAPVAYYPAYLQTGSAGIVGFWHQWRSLGNWPAGPAWFVWVLLAFDCIAAALVWIAPKWGDVLGRVTSSADRRPFALFALLVGASAAVYIPVELIFNAFYWSSFGPFTFQTSRFLHYLIYFLLGAGVGAYGLDRGLLAAQGKLVRRWPLWCGAALTAFGLASVIGIATITAHIGSRPWEVAADFTWAVSCAATSFAFLALFTRFANARRKFFDHLSDNAYGMYLIHYAFVSWLQLALVKTQLPAIAKGSLVFAGAVLLSWGTTAALRRIPAVARVI